MLLTDSSLLFAFQPNPGHFMVFGGGKFFLQ